jgi:hypothetical protein
MRRRDLLIAAGLTAALPGAALASAPKGEKKKGGGASYLQVQTLSATLTRANGRRGVLTVEVGLDVPDTNLRTFADQALPRLRAGYIQVVQSYASGLTPNAPPNADFLARELQRETDRALGKKGARLLVGTILVS